MKYLFDEFIFVLGVAIAIALFALGLRRALRARQVKGVLGKLVLAVNIALLSFGALAAQESAPDKGKEDQAGADEGGPADKEKDPAAVAREKVVDQVVRLKDWKQLRRFWRKLVKCANDNTPLSEDLVAQERAFSDYAGKEGDIPRTEQQKEDAPLISAEEALRQMKYLACEFATHIQRLHSGATCYDRNIFGGQPAPIPEQMGLIEKEFADGKISKTVYERVKQTMSAYDGRQTRITENLNTRNSLLVFRLVKEICGPAQVDISQIAPELLKKVDDLIARLGDKDSAARAEAEKALIEIGEPAIPRLRDAVKNTTDEEVRIRAERILAEIE